MARNKGKVTPFRQETKITYNKYKPNRKARRLGIKPEETLFFDDSQANVDAAAALGFNIMHVAPGKEFYDLIAEKGLS